MKLFIYIPTYNRANALKIQMLALVPQVANYPDNVRVLVSDNASCGGSISDMESEYRHLSNVIFRSNSGNIDGNANIALGFVFARKDEFLWILSDNDIVTSNAVEYILGHLDANIDFYCFNDCFSSATDVKYCIEHGWKKLQDWRMSLISDALYNMRTVASSIDDAFFYHNSSFPHLAVAFSAIKKKKHVVFRLLERGKIDDYSYDIDECPTDYSLARVGVPLLAPLFPRKEAKSFALGWIYKNGVDFYRYRKSHFNIYVQSMAVLQFYGGWMARVMLLCFFAIHCLTTPLWIVWRRLVLKGKKNLDPSTQKTLRAILKVIQSK